jgi:DNA-binding cell septation regulator SpoVG
MNLMEISEIQITPVKPQDGLIAFASFVIDKRLYICNVAIYTSGNGRGYRLVYPAKKLFDGQYIKFVHPIDKATGDAIEIAVIAKYEGLINQKFKDVAIEVANGNKPNTHIRV